VVRVEGKSDKDCVPVDGDQRDADEQDEVETSVVGSGETWIPADFRALVKRLGMRSSMGRTGVCWDNSQAELFFSMPTNERVYRTVYATKPQARSDVIRYIEEFYNSRRRHSALGYRRPNEVHSGHIQPATSA